MIKARAVGLAVVALVVTATVSSYATEPPPYLDHQRCDPRNPGHRKGDTDVASTIGQAPPRVGPGLNWWMWASTNPGSPGVHVENWGHQWFQDARVDQTGLHASGDLVGGTTGTHYLDYEVNLYTNGTPRPTACASANTGG